MTMILMLDLSSRLILVEIHLPVGHLCVCVSSMGLVGLFWISSATPVVLPGRSVSCPCAPIPMKSGGSCSMKFCMSCSAFQSVPVSPIMCMFSALMRLVMVLVLGIHLSPCVLCFQSLMLIVAIVSVCLAGCGFLLFWCVL